MVIFFQMTDIYVWEGNKVKNMQDYTQIVFWSLGFLLIDEKIYLVRHCHVKNIKVYFEIRPSGALSQDTLTQINIWAQHANIAGYCLWIDTPHAYIWTT